MTSKQVFKRMIPMVLAGALVFVLAMPMKAMAHDWDHHDNGNHYGWFHHDRDDDCDFRPHGFYPRNAYPAPPAQLPYGYGYGYNNPQMNYLQQEWNKAETKHQAALASGNRYAAKVTSQRLYNLDRDMGTTNPYGYGAYNGYYNNGYYNNGSVFGPVLGNLLGNW